MSRNRFRLPPPPQPTLNAEAFVLVPFSALPPMSKEDQDRQRALYQWAMDEAQAVVAPSPDDRDLLGNWN